MAGWSSNAKWPKASELQLQMECSNNALLSLQLKLLAITSVDTCFIQLRQKSKR